MQRELVQKSRTIFKKKCIIFIIAKETGSMTHYKVMEPVSLATWILKGLNHRSKLFSLQRQNHIFGFCPI